MIKEPWKKLKLENRNFKSSLHGIMRYNTTTIWAIILLAIALVLAWFLWNLCPKRENFNPYRCGRTGMNYLDVYEQEDYYSESPYGYPNPQSYTTAWFKLRRLYGPKRYQEKMSFIQR